MSDVGGQMSEGGNMCMTDDRFLIPISAQSLPADILAGHNG
jgi:hypothetical protein